MFDDVKGQQDRLLGDPDFDASFDQVIDTTPVTEFDISAGEARILASHRLPLNRVALSFATKPHIFGMGRVMEIYHENLECADALCVLFHVRSLEVARKGRGENMRIFGVEADSDGWSVAVGKFKWGYRKNSAAFRE